ncbi:MAG TPA: hypothetical protein DCL44_06320 [Elusimicrobia bacterium]|nr:hypothetical protein [Elusimicrobiota bacterium]
MPPSPASSPRRWNNQISKIIAVFSLLVFFGVMLFIYVKYRQFSDYMTSRINSAAGHKLGREIRFKKISLSPLRGVIIEDACVSKRPSFKSGEFFCARQTVIRPELRALLKKQVYFARVSFIDPVFKLRENSGRWDFEDLLALLPKARQGLYITWNAKELELENARLEVSIGSSGRDFVLENSNLKLLHYSSFGGNYTAEFKGLLKSAIAGKLLSSLIDLKASANFEYAGLVSLKGSLKADDASYGAITLAALSADWELFNMRSKTGDKNYFASLEAERLFIPGSENSVRRTLTGGLEMFSSVMGKSVPRIEDIEAKKIKAVFSLKNSVISLKNIEIDSNFLTLNADLAFDCAALETDSRLEAKSGPNELKLKAKGPLARPEITPEFSETLNKKLAAALKSLSELLIGYFGAAEKSSP